MESISAEAAGALNCYYYYYRRIEEEDRGGPRSVLATNLVLAVLFLRGEGGGD